MAEQVGYTITNRYSKAHTPPCSTHLWRAITPPARSIASAPPSSQAGDARKPTPAVVLPLKASCCARQPTPLLWPIKGDTEVLSSTTQQHAQLTRSPALSLLCHAYTVYGRMHELGLTIIVGQGEQLISILSLFPPSLWSSPCFPPSNPSCPRAPRAQPWRRPCMKQEEHS